MKTDFTIALAQLNQNAFHIESNFSRIITTLEAYPNADLIIFPPSFLSGVNAQDFLLHDDFLQNTFDLLNQLPAYLAPEQGLIIGAPAYLDEQLFNGIYMIQSDQISLLNVKTAEMQSGFSDEWRHFFLYETNTPYFTFKNKRFALLNSDTQIDDSFLDTLDPARFETLIHLSAAPFCLETAEAAREQAAQIVARFQKPFIYLNRTGAQDGIVFRGNSFILKENGTLYAELPAFEESCFSLQYPFNQRTLIENTKPVDPIELLIQGLAMGIRDFFSKNNLTTAIIGLSGGIDSAITTLLASVALGSDSVKTFIMPYHHTQAISLEIAADLTQKLNIEHQIIPITAQLDALHAQLNITQVDLISYQNTQARIRGLFLSTFSNLFPKSAILNTSNKSEIAVGFSTLYGDSIGALAPIADLTKGQVYQIAHYFHTQGKLPSALLERLPTAELLPHQLDSQSLPPYEILDIIVEKYILNKWNAEQIVQEHHFDLGVVQQVIEKIRSAEFKRAQAPPALKISLASFSKQDWRYPITL